MIVLFTDFGVAGPYLGQMKAVLYRDAPGAPVVDLFADAPAAMPKPSAYLLAAYAVWFPPGTVLLAVVDPGVGGSRAAVVVDADGRLYVGPDNGLFELVLRRAHTALTWRISWRPPGMSASFHGRDLFAPVAAQLVRGAWPSDCLEGYEIGRQAGWPDELPEIVYIDDYGNAMTGMRAGSLPAGARLETGGRVLSQARTFSEVPAGQAFWYENSNGLAEIAVNGGRADAALRLAIGSPITVVG
jgi:S-adenosylmethionine hydrolase